MTAPPPRLPGSGGLSRRSLLRAAFGTAAGAALAGGLSGCGSAFSAGLVGSELAPGTVTYWNLFGGGDGVRMQSMMSTYTQQSGGPSSLQGPPSPGATPTTRRSRWPRSAAPRRTWRCPT